MTIANQQAATSMYFIWALKKTPSTIGWSHHMLSQELSPTFRGHSFVFRGTSC